MNKKIRNITLLLCTSIISALGFSSCGTQKKAIQEQQRIEEEAARKAQEEAEQRAKEENDRRLMEEAERRRRELEQTKLVYGPPTRPFQPNIGK